ncbi:CHAT domain-containing protein [Rhodohalobacter sp. SW132]|uniref:CHAT domain-containing protein n=1 Tax=Rhodohalobacter sp. SW132 TaxID=2293433 RepID=UPI000E2544AB|nr:CHAT domain-containing protein [Rhodohalobacter sp. SW132]REL24988.1 CHAT domain-containing protein [Rhodohalobacter sp. SW132]
MAKKVFILLITFFVSIATYSPAQSQITDIEVFDSSPFINGEPIESDLLWTFAILFHSSDKNLQESLLQRVNNQQLLDALDTSSTRNSILNIAFEYMDEKMLLIYLLNEPSESERISKFDEFYSKYEANPLLNDINHSISKNVKLNLDEVKFSDFPSVFFYLLEYNQFTDVIGREIYSHIIEFYENEFHQLQLSKIETELYLSALFYAYYSTDQFGPIADIFQELIAFEKFPISHSKLNLFWSLDYAMYSLGYLDRSLEVQREFSLPISDYLGDEGSIHAIYSSHGGYLYMLGKYREAREVFESTLRRSDNLSDQNLTRLYNNLSLVYFSTGESDKYIETQLKALEHSQSYNNFDHQIGIHRNLHIFYRKNQNFELASTYIDRAADLAEQLENLEDLISILISKSVFESTYLNNIYEADQYLLKAEALLNDDINSRFVIRIFSERAELLQSQDRIDESINYWKEVANIALSQNNTPIYLESLVSRANLNFKLGNYTETYDLLKKFRAHDITVVDFSVLTLSRIVQAMLYHQNGELTRAKDLFAETTELVLERARYSADLETGYWTVEGEYMQLFETYADFLIERNMTTEAVQMLDRIKTINDASMLQNPLITSSQLSEEQLSRDQQITREMETLRRKLFVASNNERLQLNNQIERLQAQKRELFRDQRSMPVNQREIPIWSIQRSLGSDQVMMHITSINDSYYISQVTRDDIDIRKVNIDEDLKSVFETAIQGMISGRTDLNALYEIGQMLNINDLSKSYSSLILIPDGYLHQLPPDVIPLNKPVSSHSYGATTFLIEHMDVRTLNRLDDMRQRRQSIDFEYDFTGFGVADFQNSTTNRSLMPLPQAPGEVSKIQHNLQRFPKRTAFIEHDATPQRFKEIAGNSRILHMATHSEISESDPLFSRLHLLPDQFSDDPDPANQIFAYELFELNLQNELIMLNSCESGGDRAIQGSGIMGLSRALHYAGAQSLILNAWSVNDQFAADFAEMFYHHINEGETKSRALQLTKIDFIKNKNANPHFWGPYILNGNNEPLIQKRGANLGNWLIALIFIAGFFVVTRTRNSSLAA